MPKKRQVSTLQAVAVLQLSYMGLSVTWTAKPLEWANMICTFSEHTWPARASESERRDVANQICMQIWWAAMDMVPCLAAMDVANVKTMRRAIVRPIKSPPVV